jgi:hypothetical protein
VLPVAGVARSSQTPSTPEAQARDAAAVRGEWDRRRRAKQIAPMAHTSQPPPIDSAPPDAPTPHPPDFDVAAGVQTRLELHSKPWAQSLTA